MLDRTPLLRPLLALIFLLGCTDPGEQHDPHPGGQLGALEQKKATLPTKRTEPQVGTVIDRFNGVAVYYNGQIRNTHGRHITSDGYNLGLKWQCVEFVKRYYYQTYQHKMPDPWGHAIDFFMPTLRDGGFNTARGLHQFRNPSSAKPLPGDIMVFKGEDNNPFGHIAIVTKVGANYVEVIQQNVGKQTRYTLPLFDMVDSWRIANIDVLGWLGRLEGRE